MSQERRIKKRKRKVEALREFLDKHDILQSEAAAAILGNPRRENEISRWLGGSVLPNRTHYRAINKFMKEFKKND